MATVRPSMDSIHSTQKSEAATAIYDRAEDDESSELTTSISLSPALATHEQVETPFHDQEIDFWAHQRTNETPKMAIVEPDQRQEKEHAYLRIKDLEDSEPSGRSASADLESYAESLPFWNLLPYEEQQWALRLVTKAADINNATEACQREILTWRLAGLSHGLHDCPDGYLEDCITIECYDNTNIGCQPHDTEKPVLVRLVIARSQLMHSGWFVNWFNSPQYLARAGMKISWPQDPFACWQMVKSYMEDGYDRFGSNQIMTYVCTNFHLADRFIVLVRLYKLARVLELFGLMDGAFAVLTQMEHLIAPPNVVTLARYIFGGEKYCETIVNLRKWCLKWICKHYEWLTDCEQWARVVENSVPELKEHWMRITSIKRRISEEELKRSLQRNVSDATTIIDAVKAVNTKSETPTQREPRCRAEHSKSPITSNREYTFIKLERSGISTPLNEQTASDNIIDFSKLQLSFSGGDNNTSDSVDKGKSTVHLSAPGKPSFKETVEGYEEDRGISSEEYGKGKRKQHVSAPRKSSFREVFEEDVKYDQKDRVPRAGSLPGRKRDPVSSLINGLTASMSEPLLESRHLRTGAYNNGKDGAIDQEEIVHGTTIPTEDKDDNTTLRQEDPHSPSQRGVVLTAEALQELDRWPLADVPLPDPLLPLTFGRAISEQRGRPQREDRNNIHHLGQAITIFGRHRPGMGGSLASVNENFAPGESRARVANEAKARELLGIDTPGTVDVVRSRSRRAQDAEAKRPKKRTTWLG